VVASAIFCLIVAAGACGQANKGTAGDGEASNVARLERSTALLERQVELAGGKDFYLLLDPAAADLTLMLRGAELRRFAVLGLQIGYPRVSWFDRRQSRAWQGLIWANGELIPPRPIDRIVITGEERAKGEEEPPPPPIPPTAEELYPVPSTYLVRFGGGLSIEIRPREADANAGRLARFRTWWTAKWSNVASAISASNRDVVRLRVVLNSKDAESLYRSLPPSVRLLVLAGEPPGR
jgi:hypothetical protein